MGLVWHEPVLLRMVAYFARRAREKCRLSVEAESYAILIRVSIIKSAGGYVCH